jgi:hypothetical protein
VLADVLELTASADALDPRVSGKSRASPSSPTSHFPSLGCFISFLTFERLQHLFRRSTRQTLAYRPMRPNTAGRFPIAVLGDRSNRVIDRSGQ